MKISNILPVSPSSISWLRVSSYWNWKTCKTLILHFIKTTTTEKNKGKITLRKETFCNLRNLPMISPWQSLQGGTHKSPFLWQYHLPPPHSLLEVSLHPHLMKLSKSTGTGGSSVFTELRRPEISFQPHSVGSRAFASSVFETIAYKCTHRLWKTHFFLFIEVFLEEVAFDQVKTFINICCICTYKQNKIF